MIDLSQFDNRHFQRGASRWTEATWLVTRLLFFHFPLPLPSSLRAFLLRAFGAKVGRGVTIRSGVRITFPWRLEIGDHAWIGEDVRILNLADVRIGRSTCISQNAFLCTGSHDFTSPGFDLLTKPIQIGDSCWVAANVFVGPGVTVDAGGMCAAGGVVVKDVQSGTVVAGNPAKVIKRFEKGDG